MEETQNEETLEGVDVAAARAARRLELRGGHLALVRLHRELVDLADGVGGLGRLRRREELAHAEDGEEREDRHDGDHDHELDERKTARSLLAEETLHGLSLSVMETNARAGPCEFSGFSGLSPPQVTFFDTPSPMDRRDWSTPPDGRGGLTHEAP